MYPDATPLPDAIDAAVAVGFTRFGVYGAAKTVRETVVFPAPEAEQALLQRVPLERLGKEEDIANAVAFLASGEASFITGQVLYVDGGSVSQIRPPAYTANLKRPANTNKTSS